MVNLSIVMLNVYQRGMVYGTYNILQGGAPQ